MDVVGAVRRVGVCGPNVLMYLKALTCSQQREGSHLLHFF